MNAMNRIALVATGLHWAPIIVGAVIGLAAFLPPVVSKWWSEYRHTSLIARLQQRLDA